MTAVALALAASLAWGVGDFLGAAGSRRLSVLTVLAVSQTAGLVVVAVLLAALGEPPPGAAILLPALAAGLAGVVGLGALYRGMAVGAVAIVAPISSAAAVIPLAVGLIQGERPSSIQLAGIGLVLGGVALASREHGPVGRRVAAGVGLALVAAVGFGGYIVLIAEASAESPLWAVLVARSASSVLALAAAARRSQLPASPRVLPGLAVIGVFDVAANAFLAYALTLGLISVVAVLASLYPVVTILLARAVFGERVARAQQLGVVGALTGVALVSGG